MSSLHVFSDFRKRKALLASSRLVQVCTEMQLTDHKNKHQPV